MIISPKIDMSSLFIGNMLHHHLNIEIL